MVVLQATDQAGSDLVTNTVTPVADSYVESTAPSTNFGTSARLVVDASPVRESYLRFDLSSLTGPVEEARLRIHVANITDAGSPSGGSVALVGNNTWTETGITYDNRPTTWGDTVASFGSVVRDTWVEVPVTTIVITGGVLTIGIRSTNGDGAYFDSRQTTATAPQLVVTSGTSPSTSSSSTTSTTTLPPNGTTTYVAPVADTYVDSSTPTTSYGTSTRLIVDSSPTRVAYLRFDLTALSGPVTDARLRIHVADVSGAQSPVGGSVVLVSNNSWTEAGTTYDTRPTSFGPSVATIGAVGRNTWVEVPVTGAFATGMPVSFAILSTSSDNAVYDSRQASSTIRPRLVVTTGTAPPADTIRIAAVGDNACTAGGSVTATQCRQVAVSSLLVNDASIQKFLALGDLQYENGTLTDFLGPYDSSYGRVKDKTAPTVGNHEYGTASASGYFNYFGAAAGDPTKGYFSYDLGPSWHVVNLNTNCGPVSCSATGAQMQWLRADLAANTKACVLATGHHPRFSSSNGVGNDPEQAPFWDALAQYGTDVYLVGHAHGYERFAPQLANATADASGIRQIVVGTGGRSLFGFVTPVANSVVRISAFGILKMELGGGTYSWQFVDEAGTVRDSGNGTCH